MPNNYKIFDRTNHRSQFPTIFQSILYYEKFDLKIQNFVINENVHQILFKWKYSNTQKLMKKKNNNKIK